jgi:putative oxidoreductase
MDTSAQTMSSSSGRKWLAMLFGSRSGSTAADLALGVIRLALGWIFFVYGSQKLFGWFGGPGIDPTAGFMASIGLKPGTFYAYLSGIIEFGGAIAMLLGVITRLAALALIGDMIMAMIKVTAEQGLHPYSNAPGYGLNVALIALALVMFLLGAGRYSVDAQLERSVVAEG